MDLKVFPSKLKGTVEATTSKTYTQRLLIAAALADKPTVILSNCISHEIEITISCLNTLGANITVDSNRITVEPIKEIKSFVEIDCDDSSLVLRFLLPIAAALGINASFFSTGKPIAKPVIPLRNEMQKYGVKFTPPWEFPIEISGKLQAGEFKIIGPMSSQYVTGLLFALPLVDGESKIDISQVQKYRNYIDMTLEVLEKFGIEYSEKDGFLVIKGNQKYISPSEAEIEVEGDWLSSACLLAAGALSDEVTVTGLDLESFQGEKEILNILKEFGADISANSNGVTVRKSELHGIQVDAELLYDLVPIISVVGANCEKGVTILTNVMQIRIGEFFATTLLSECLTLFGCVSAQTEDGLVIWSGESIIGGDVSSLKDFKLVMALMVLATNSSSEIIIKGIDCILKANPMFLENYKKLGGRFDVINN